MKEITTTAFLGLVLAILVVFALDQGRPFKAEEIAFVWFFATGLVQLVKSIFGHFRKKGEKHGD